MKKIIKKLALSIVTISSLSLNLSTQAQAFSTLTQQKNPIDTQTIYLPENQENIIQNQIKQQKIVTFKIPNSVTRIVGGIGAQIIKKVIRDRMNPEQQNYDDLR